MQEVAEFMKKVIVDGKNVKNDVREFMSNYTKVHYTFKEDDAYKYIEFF